MDTKTLQLSIETIVYAISNYIVRLTDNKYICYIDNNVANCDDKIFSCRLMIQDRNCNEYQIIVVLTEAIGEIYKLKFIFDDKIPRDIFCATIRGLKSLHSLLHKTMNAYEVEILSRFQSLKQLIPKEDSETSLVEQDKLLI